MYKSIKIRDFRLFKNQTITFGKYLTVLSGRNSTGKSTILGMVANSGELKKKDGVTYLTKQFRADFSELFKGSKEFDKIGANRFEITLCDNDGNIYDYRSFRTAWQQKDKDRKQSTPTEKETIKRDRFRIIPFKKENGKQTEAKFKYPVIYLGLSRLFPLGESNDESINTKALIFKSEEHKKWFTENYKHILSMHTDVKDITNYSIGETDKKSGVGINTDEYDYLTNSSGQDNLGQILLALLSFRKLKEGSGNAWNGGILLIDEIEAALHPAAQNRLVQLLIREARANELQVVFTTHSISLIRDICSRIAYNRNDDNTNNDIELYYFTNANRKLEIKRNISFTEIERDLLVTSIVQSYNRIKVYTEDEEARWFLRHLIPEYLTYLELLETTIGCNELINLYNADISYFKNVLVVFDGDVEEKHLKKIPDPLREKFGNIIKLPGDKRPEEIIYRYIIVLNPDHDYWDVASSQYGFTWDYFNDHGPESDDYGSEDERDRYKKWFNYHKPFFESTKLIEFWKRDNPEVVDFFKKDFQLAYNSLAKRTAASEIMQK